MMAGATSRRDVSQVYEFPEYFRRDKRRAMLMFGTMTSTITLVHLSIASADPSAADPLVLLVDAMLWVFFLKLATSKRPMAFRDGMVEVGGRMYHPGSVSGLDVMIDHGRPGAKNFRMRLLATIVDANGTVQRAVTTGAKAEQARRMLAEVRQRLPHAVVRDLSGLIEPVSPAPVTNWPLPAPITTITQVLPVWTSSTHPRIVPERMSLSRPSWAPLPRPVQDGRRGERHLERLALASCPRLGTCLRTPSIVAEWV